MTYFQNLAVASALAIVFVSNQAFAGDKHDQTMKSKSAYIMEDSSNWSNMNSDDRAKHMEHVKSNMTESQKEALSNMDEEQKRKWMDKAIMREKQAMQTNHDRNNAHIKADHKKSHHMLSKDKSAEAMKKNDTIGEVLQADAEPDVQSDREMLMYDGRQMTKASLISSEGDNNVKNNSITVPTVNSNVVTTVACPVGTTAQPNMTCLVTGNYNPSS